MLESDKVFSKHDKHFLSRPETCTFRDIHRLLRPGTGLLTFDRNDLADKRVLGKVVHALGKSLELGLNMEESSLLVLGMDEEIPLGLHFGMFIPTLAGQSDREQQQKWLPLAKTFSIIGCYAQTELGHGSNVRG